MVTLKIFHYTDRYDTVENSDCRNDNCIPLMDSFSRRMLEFVTVPVEKVNVKASDDKTCICGLSKDDWIPVEYVNNSIEKIRIHFFFIFYFFKFQISMVFSFFLAKVTTVFSQNKKKTLNLLKWISSQKRDRVTFEMNRVIE